MISICSYNNIQLSASINSSKYSCNQINGTNENNYVSALIWRLLCLTRAYIVHTQKARVYHKRIQTTDIGIEQAKHWALFDSIYTFVPCFWNTIDA